ncbi:MAG: nitroreductase family deazaflavin-dependent oxidoreductase [Chloroflexi bacterium]|nr:nitroreductase family deazaflavin-dependent oxidoreductase [Chloroflexota bacterium]
MIYNWRILEECKLGLKKIRWQATVRLHQSFAEFYLAWGYRFLGNYYLVITTTGRKSGLPRHVPVGYVKVGEYIYTITRAIPLLSNWLRNVRQNPQVNLNLGGKSLKATGEILENPDQVRQVIRLFLKCRPGYSRFLGVDLDSSEEELERAARRWQAVRFQLDSPKKPSKAKN